MIESGDTDTEKLKQCNRSILESCQSHNPAERRDAQHASANKAQIHNTDSLKDTAEVSHIGVNDADKTVVAEAQTGGKQTAETVTKMAENGELVTAKDKENAATAVTKVASAAMDSMQSDDAAVRAGGQQMFAKATEAAGAVLANAPAPQQVKKAGEVVDNALDGAEAGLADDKAEVRAKAVATASAAEDTAQQLEGHTATAQRGVGARRRALDIMISGSRDESEKVRADALAGLEKVIEKGPSHRHPERYEEAKKALESMAQNDPSEVMKQRAQTALDNLSNRAPPTEEHGNHHDRHSRREKSSQLGASAPPPP
jgi:hypothetical protein